MFRYKNVKKKFIILTILFVSILSLTSCDKIKNVINSKNSSETAVTTINYSPIKTSDKFMNSLHVIRNPENYNQMVFRGDGKYLDKTLDSYVSYINPIINAKDGLYYYYYITDYTAEVATTSYISSTTNEVYEDLIPISKTRFYNDNGEEIDIGINSYSALFEINGLLFVRDQDVDYYENNLRIFDTSDNSLYIAPNVVCDYVNIKDKTYLLFSTEPYGENPEEDKLTIITDEGLNVIKTIDGYSLDSVDNSTGEKQIVLAKLFKREENDYINNTEYELRYNTLNEDLEFSDSEEKPHPKKEDEGELNNSFKIKNEYNELAEKIRTSDEKYSFVTTYVDFKTTKVRLLAYYNDRVSDIAGYTQDVDVFDEKGELLGTLEEFDSCYQEDGYLFYNHDTVCDFDLNIIKKFDSKFYLEQFNNSGKRYYADKYNVRDFTSRNKMTIYDENFNPIYENVDSYNPYTFYDYLIVVIDNKTKFIKDGEVVKEFDRYIDVYNSYNEGDYRTFYDNNTTLYGIIDKDLNIVLDDFRNIIDLEKDYFTFEKGFRYGLMDYQGGEIISFSIFNTIKE